MALLDSVDKIVTRYFAFVTLEEFEYKNKIYQPKEFTISPLLFRDYTCPSRCGGCCPRFSLDYLPGELMLDNVEKRNVQFNGKDIVVFSDAQDDHTNHHCRNLDLEGRCGIYTVRPFSCDFKLIRPLIFIDPGRKNNLTQKLFGRGWNFKRVDGQRGALCEMTPITKKSINEVIRKIQRLEQWCGHFGLLNKCNQIISHAENFKKDFLYPFFNTKL